jgi:hypothetical protein
MRLMFGLLTCLCAYQGIQALAAEPPGPTSSSVQPATTAIAAPAATAASSSSPAKTTAATTTAASPPKEALDAAEKKLRSQGYKPEVHNGKTIYCRRETQLGSHFESKTCSTPDQILRAQQDSKDAVDQMQRTERGPPSN